MARFKDCNWELPETPDHQIKTWEAVQFALLMDIRDELQTLNRLLSCRRFMDIPLVLDQIQRNTKKRPRKKTTRKKQ